MVKESPSAEAPANFVREIVAKDVAAEKNGGTVVTRFPPEPNGYLHIGHAYASFISYRIAAEFGGKFNLRYDDTNPTKEDIEYAEAQARDLKWLGLDWGDEIFHASDYFERMYDHAVTLIKAGKAYVCELSKDDVRQYRGTPSEAGKDSPFRKRSAEENLSLFAKMRRGEIEEGKAVLRAKLDMASPNMILRDPIMYRIQKTPHYRAGDQWNIYPTYDWAHGLEDSIEGVTHSLCSLEFVNHRPLYDWFLEQLGVHHPQQIEFSRMNLSHTVMSKRWLLQLVEDKRVSGWDDPRMPTIAGMRRRGFSPEAVRDFLGKLGVSRSPTHVDMSLLEYCVREDCDARSERRFAVLKPLKVVIENYPEDQEEQFDADNHPNNEDAGTRKLAFSKVIYIEQEDFMLEPPKKYHRLSPGKEIRLKHAYYITCTGYDTDPDTGAVTEVRCSYDPESRGGSTPDGRKVRGTSHWLSAKHAIKAEVRLYDRLFASENPSDVEEGASFVDQLAENSLEVAECLVEPSLDNLAPGETFQFLRQGFFSVDPDSKPGAPVFNRTVALRDSWSKIAKKN